MHTPRTHGEIRIQCTRAEAVRRLQRRKAGGVYQAPSKPWVVADITLPVTPLFFLPQSKQPCRMLAEPAVALYSPFKATFAPKKACQRPCKRVRTRKSSSGWGWMILTSPDYLLSEKPVLKCCVCGEDEIPSPPGTVPSSRFFCRGCCELIWIARHIAEARDTSMEAALGIARDTIAKQSRQRWPVSNRTDSVAGAKSHSQSSAQVATLQ